MSAALAHRPPASARRPQARSAWGRSEPARRRTDWPLPPAAVTGAAVGLSRSAADCIVQASATGQSCRGRAPAGARTRSSAHRQGRPAGVLPAPPVRSGLLRFSEPSFQCWPSAVPAPSLLGLLGNGRVRRQVRRVGLGARLGGRLLGILLLHVGGDLGMGQQGGTQVGPVVGMRRVPVDGLAEALLPVLRLGPAQGLELGRVHVVALVVEDAVLHVADALLGHLELLGDGGDHLLDGSVHVGADVVALADAALVHDHVEGGRHVPHVQVGAALLAVAVDPEGHAAQGQVDHLGDQLLRVLPRSIDVVAARDDDGELVAVHVARAQHLRARLRGGVGVRRLHLG
mmetsp:Transcript_24380/g.71768  ORF Transcript_24380/g.71768 Transcript_24380/m.71768 type:complete len:344 (-) Transcript_24380:106-1137(-)